MTVNKSQGQTFHGRVGVFLPEWVFGHGQLYVAESHVVHPDNIRFCVLHRPPEMAEVGRNEATVPTDEEEMELLREFEEAEDLRAMDYEEEIDMLRDMEDMEEEGGDDDEERAMREMELQADSADMDEEIIKSLQEIHDDDIRVDEHEDEEDIMRQMEEEEEREDGVPPARPAPTVQDPPRQDNMSSAPPASSEGRGGDTHPVRTRNVVYAEALQ